VAKSIKYMAVYLFFQNEQIVIVKKRPEFIITVKNEFGIKFAILKYFR